MFYKTRISGGRVNSCELRGFQRKEHGKEQEKGLYTERTKATGRVLNLGRIPGTNCTRWVQGNEWLGLAGAESVWREGEDKLERAGQCQGVAAPAGQRRHLAHMP